MRLFLSMSNKSHIYRFFFFDWRAKHSQHQKELHEYKKTEQERTLQREAAQRVQERWEHDKAPEMVAPLATGSHSMHSIDSRTGLVGEEGRSARAKPPPPLPADVGDPMQPQPQMMGNVGTLKQTQGRAPGTLETERVHIRVPATPPASPPKQRKPLPVPEEYPPTERVGQAFDDPRGHRDRQGDTQRERQGDIQRERQGDTQRERQGDTQRERQGDVRADGQREGHRPPQVHGHARNASGGSGTGGGRMQLADDVQYIHREPMDAQAAEGGAEGAPPLPPKARGKR